MKVKELKKVLESLEELSVDQEIFQFGPAYEAAKRNQKIAINIIKSELTKINTKTPTTTGTDWWTDMENSVKGF